MKQEKGKRGLSIGVVVALFFSNEKSEDGFEEFDECDDRWDGTEVSFID